MVGDHGALSLVARQDSSACVAVVEPTRGPFAAATSGGTDDGECVAVAASLRRSAVQDPASAATATMATTATRTIPFRPDPRPLHISFFASATDILGCQ